MSLRKLLKQEFVIGLMLSMLISVTGVIYAGSQPLNVQVQTDYYSIDGSDLKVKWLKVEILKGNKNYIAFQETFYDYVITDGVVDLNLGSNNDNRINPYIFNEERNWIRITIDDYETIPPATIVTMNTDVISLFSNLALESPTGNLFPDLSNSKEHIVMTDQYGEAFTYITTKNLMELLPIKNKDKLEDILTIDPMHNMNTLIIKNKDYEKISTATLIEKLNIGPIALKSKVPSMADGTYKYLKVNEEGTAFELINELDSILDEQIIATLNIFTQSFNNDQEILLWNPSNEKFEGSTIDTLGFIEELDVQISYDTENYEILIENWGSITINNLLDNTDKQSLELNEGILSLSESNTVIDLDEILINDVELNEMLLDLDSSMNVVELGLVGIDLAMNSNHILTITGGEVGIDFTQYLDNVDEQQLMYDVSNGILRLTNGGLVDLTLPGDKVGTDEQSLSYNELTNILILENSNAPIVNLSDLQDNTDFQELTMVDGLLSITREGLSDSTVDLKAYLGTSSTGNIGVDVQPYNTYLDRLADDGILEVPYVEYGEYFINEAGLQGQIWTSDGDGSGFWAPSHNLSLTNDMLSLVGDSTTVDLSKYKQEISFVDNVLYLSYEGGAVDYGYLGSRIGTDDQEIIELSVVESEFRIDLEDGGGGVSVNLASIDTQLTDSEIANFGYIKMDSLTPVRNDFQDYDIILEGRVLSNKNAIATHEDSINTIHNAIDTNTNDIAINTFNINVNSSDIADNSNNIDINEGIMNENEIEIIENSNNIAVNEAGITLNEQNIDGNRIEIELNESSIAINNVNITNNNSDIASNISAIQLNNSNIASNNSEIEKNIEDISINVVNIGNVDTGIEDNNNAINSNKAASDTEDLALNARINNLDISLVEDELRLTGDETVVDLSPYKQSISFNNNILTISDAGTASFEFSNDIGTDDQNITQFNLSGTTLSVGIEDGGSVKSIDISSIDTQLTDLDISNLGYIKIDSVTLLKEDLEAEDVVLQARIDTVISDYMTADENLSSIIREDFGLADELLLASININTSAISELDTAYKEDDIAIRAEFLNEDTILQGDINQNEIVTDLVDGELISSININRDEISNLETDYQEEDVSIRAEFLAADTVLQGNVNQNEINTDAADSSLIASINMNIALISELEAGYQLEDSNIRAEFLEADIVLQGYIDQKEEESNDADEALQVSINSNVTSIESIESSYQDNDWQLQQEFEEADSEIDAKINNLDIELDGAQLSLTSEDSTPVNIGIFDQELSFNEFTNIITLSNGGSFDLSSIDTTLDEATVDEMLADNGYLTEIAGVSWDEIVNIPSGFLDNNDRDTDPGVYFGFVGGEATSGMIPTASVGDQDKYFRANANWDNPIKDEEITSLNYIKIAKTETIATSAVTTEKIADNAIITEKIVDNAITTEKITDNAITAEKIGVGVITTSKIQNGAISNEKISTVNWSKITGTPSTFVGMPPGGEGSPTLVPKLNNETDDDGDLFLQGNGTWSDPVQDSKISEFGYIKRAQTGNINDNAVITSKIADQAVTVDKIKDGNITTDKIANGAITTDKFEDGAITTDKIAPNAITNEKISAVNWSKINGEPSIFTGFSAGGEGIPALVPKLNNATDANGDFFLQGDGTWSDPIQDSRIASLGYIKRAQTGNIVNNHVTTEKINNGAVTSIKILNGHITTDKIANGAITTHKIRNGAITTSKIKNNDITNEKISDVNWSDVTGAPARFSGQVPGGESGGRLVPPPPGDASSSKHYYLIGNGSWYNMPSPDHNHNEFVTPHGHNFAPKVTHDHIYVRKDQHDHSSFQVDFNHNFALYNHLESGEGSGCIHCSGHGSDYYYNGNGGWSKFGFVEYTGNHGITLTGKASNACKNISPSVSNPQNFSVSKTKIHFFGTCFNAFDFGSISNDNWVEFDLWAWWGQPSGSYAIWTVFNSNYPDKTHIVGQLQQNGWKTLSDKRVKDNITTIKDALYKIQNIRGVRYDRKSTKYKKGGELGVIAQELQPYLPEVVSIPKDNKDYLTVNYSRIAPLLIEGVKELNKEIEEDLVSLNTIVKSRESLKANELKELKEKNKALKEKLAYLTKRIHAIESKRAER